MGTFVLTFVIFLLAGGGLALGVLFGRAPLRGSCGGLACHKAISCDACQAGKDPQDD